uniref:Uncharacterized protein n=1 Tax=Xiphophorus couchianus TaxID=32473 RepID=A0A3B5KQD5_9TELE
CLGLLLWLVFPPILLLFGDISDENSKEFLVQVCCNNSLPSHFPEKNGIKILSRQQI